MTKRQWCKKYLFPILTLLFVIGISVGIFLFYRSSPERLETLQGYGYLGAFLISLTFNASVFLPTGNFLVMAALGAVMPSAALVGLAGGVGAAIGELTGYMAGYSGRGVVSRLKLYNRLVQWLKRWGILSIFVLSLIPFFFDLAGIAAGVLRYPLWKFLLACWAGRTLLYIGLAYAGAWGWDVVLGWIG
ncbi:MAG: VTT domain-containing protein [Dehalococcoidia bacterium]|jgi:membrane protein DedA with SNARE-associated domain